VTIWFVLLQAPVNLVGVVIIQKICLFPEEQLEGQRDAPPDCWQGCRTPCPIVARKFWGAAWAQRCGYVKRGKLINACCKPLVSVVVGKLLSRPVPLLCATNMHEGRRVRQPASLSRCRPETSIVVCTMRTQTTSPRTTPRTCTLWRLHSAMAPNNLSVRRQALGATTSPGLGPMGRACAVLALASLTGLSHALSCISLHLHERTGPTPRHSPGHQE